MNLKRNMKAAFTTVKSNFKEYVCFIIALLMVQMLFCTLTVCLYNNRSVEKQMILDAGYTYHCSMENLEAADFNDLSNLYVYHSSQRSLTFEYAFTADRSKVHITFTGEYRKTAQYFNDALKVMNSLKDHVSMTMTPLYDFEVSSGSVFGAMIPLLVLLMVLSYFLVMALFRIRLNHFKFTYAVYMTFGANYKKLFSAAFYEMAMLVLLSFPVSVLLSYGAAALLYLPNGAPFGFYFVSLPVTLVCSLVCSLLALLLPIKLLARSAPVRLFKAEDNSNLVSSPRKSSDFLKKKIARTELRGLWRFRKHIAALLLSTVSFAVVFLLGAYLADAYTARSSVNKPDFTVNARDENIYAMFAGYFKEDVEAGEFDAVLEKAARDPYRPGGERENAEPVNLALKKENIVTGSFTDLPRTEGFAATESLEIRAFDEDALSCLSTVYDYRITGDPAKLLTDSSAVILSSSMANVRALKISPGDTVYISVNYLPMPGTAKTDYDLESLGTRLEGGIYTYRAFTVAAVVENYADYDKMLLYLPTCEAEGEISGYETVMGQKAVFTSARIHTGGVSDESKVMQYINWFLKNKGEITFTRTYNSLYESILRAQNHAGMILMLSFLLLAVSPLAGIFSQILFYGKRKLEFDVLRAVGGTKKQLRTLFAVDAVTMVVLSAGCYAGFSFLAVRLANAFLNSRFAFIFSSDSGRATNFSADIPLLPFFAGLILTMVFAGLAVLLPALLYKRAASEHVAADFDRNDE